MSKKDQLYHGGSRRGFNFRGVKVLDTPDETETSIVHRRDYTYFGRERSCKDHLFTYQDFRTARPNKVHREQHNLSGAFNHVRN